MFKTVSCERDLTQKQGKGITSPAEEGGQWMTVDDSGLLFHAATAGEEVENSRMNLNLGGRKCHRKVSLRFGFTSLCLTLFCLLIN